MKEPAAVSLTSGEPVRTPTRFTVWTFVKYVALQVVIFLGLYVLSIGPMFWHWYDGRNMETNSPVAFFYEPLYLLAGWCEPFGEFMNWYVDLWVG